mmetsp:Transcript_3551/g.6216  ORF Transcript_3551/g.6216 Transcript_3551/m.6216 type:complete len:354 (-) Transcript_3551:1016-2077(-)
MNSIPLYITSSIQSSKYDVICGSNSFTCGFRLLSLSNAYRNRDRKSTNSIVMLFPNPSTRCLLFCELENVLIPSSQTVHSDEVLKTTNLWLDLFSETWNEHCRLKNNSCIGYSTSKSLEEFKQVQSQFPSLPQPDYLSTDSGTLLYEYNSSKEPKLNQEWNTMANAFWNIDTVHHVIESKVQNTSDIVERIDSGANPFRMQYKLRKGLSIPKFVENVIDPMGKELNDSEILPKFELNPNGILDIMPYTCGVGEALFHVWNHILQFPKDKVVAAGASEYSMPLFLDTGRCFAIAPGNASQELIAELQIASNATHYYATCDYSGALIEGLHKFGYLSDSLWNDIKQDARFTAARQ